MDWLKPDKAWTLFLDRDGVINYEKVNDYIYNPGEFKFYEGVLEAMHIFRQLFGRIILVTNQRGIEKGLMTVQNLEDIHHYMQSELSKVDGVIDAIFYCSSLDDQHPNRKPQPGMAYQAREKYPEIDFTRSVMVGNNLSDMYFGRNTGMKTVYVQTTHPDLQLPHPSVDLACKDLLNFAKLLEPALKW
jgi:D,D-heptose 1,7-bisphosphate phosphatase